MVVTLFLLDDCALGLHVEKPDRRKSQDLLFIGITGASLSFVPTMCLGCAGATEWDDGRAVVDIG